MTATLFIPLKDYVEHHWPQDILELPSLDALDHIWIEPLDIDQTSGLMVNTAILFQEELALGIPGLDAAKLVFAPQGSNTAFAFEFKNSPSTQFRVVDIPIALRFDPTLLKPARRVVSGNSAQPESFEVDESVKFLDVVLGKVTLTVDEDGNFTVAGAVNITLPLLFIGETGVVIEASDISLHLDANSPPSGKPVGWRGVHIGHAAVHLPGGLSSTVGTLEMTNAYIGNGGFSGTVSDTWTPAQAAQMFGVDFSLQHAELTFVQNALTATAISGQMTVPFFDEPLAVEIGLNLNGTFAVRLSDANGLLTLTKPDILSVEVDSLGFEVADDLFTVKLSGQIKPLFGGLDWPTLKVKELSIDSQGNVHLEGGWLDLPDQYSLDFHGFQIEITKLGFGKTEDGGKWIGFSGGLKLVDGLSAGASVEGLRITWYDDEPGQPHRATRITLNGVGVEFEIPDVLRFKGAIAYRELPGNVHRFDGSIKLELTTLSMEIDGTLVIGSAPGYTFFAIYLEAELPAGIPLWSTGLAAYGVAGLFALNMKPDKAPAAPWYEIGGTDDWYHRGTDGVTDLATKWTNDAGATALGAGLTIGTVADNGFTFSGRVLLVISFPGPVLLLQGSANILEERAKLSEDALFRALAVLDFRAGTFLIGLDAQYKFGGGGELIKIGGGVEAFFSFSDADAWHLYLGLKDPREKRIRAELFQLFEANSYFMLDSHQLAMGAWVGYDKHWSFGPLKVTVEAWIEGNAVVSWRPVYFHGDLWLHGKAELRVFGFGVGLSVDASFAADVFDPFHILATFGVGISLPFPFPDFHEDITLEWGPSKIHPALPLPLKEVAVEHFKSTKSWPLPRGGDQPLLLPNYDTDGDGSLNRNSNGDPQPPDISVALQEAAPPPDNAPFVPLDARPHITFSRPVHDLAMIGVNGQGVTPEWERIGDPAKNEGPVQVRYSLTEVALHKHNGSGWDVVARTAMPSKPGDPPPGDPPKLYGSWAPVPALPDGAGTKVGQVKLWLWSKTPFDYTRHSSGAWDEWFTDRFTDYPCLIAPPSREVCCDFESIAPEKTFPSPWRCSNDDRFTIAWAAPLAQSTVVLSQPIEGRTHALCFPGDVPGVFVSAMQNLITITPPEPAEKVRIVVTSQQEKLQRKCIDFRRSLPDTGVNPRTEQDVKFLARDSNGQPANATRIIFADTNGGPLAGVDCGFALEITLPAPVTEVTLLLTRGAQAATLEAFNADGSSAIKRQTHNPTGVPETLTLSGQSIVRVVISPPGGEMVLHEVCYARVVRSGVEVQAVGLDAAGKTYGPFLAKNGVIEVVGNAMTRVNLRSPHGFCLVRVCVTIGPSTEELVQQEKMMQHTRDELARWTQTGDVLEPHTNYRLRIATKIETQATSFGTFDQTEFAYFRTDGPPGLTTLSVPVGTQNEDEFKAGFDDLTLYVRQTVPATVPSPGAKAPLPRPVYRGYDVGVEFNEDYVDLMYRLEGRDLGLYLYDSNNRPVRDVRGRLIVLNNRWGHAEDLHLEAGEKLWISTLNRSDCASFPQVIPHSNTLSSAEGQVLDADTLYEARLVPFLLHEAFMAFSINTSVNGPAGLLGRWMVHDEGGNDAPSHWEVREEGSPPSRYLIQTTNIWGGTTADSDPVKPGTLLLYGDNPALLGTDPNQPGNWTDYRFSTYVRSKDDDTLGVVFRYVDENHYYRFSLDRQRKYRRLTRLMNGIHTVLAEDDFVYQQEQDYLVTIEAIGSSLRVYQDGVMVFDVTDGTLDHGRIGLYSWGNEGACFRDVRVDDFRLSAPTVYNFKFTTSQFVNFFHHLHSFQDEIWRALLPGTEAIAAEISQAGVLAVPPTRPDDEETRAYDALAAKVLGQGAQKNPPELQVTRVEQDENAVALLVQSPEPIDWRRTQISVLYADRQLPPPTLPDAVKLTEVSFAATQPNEESVSLLLRQPTNLTGYRIESRGLPKVLAEPTGDSTLLVDDFTEPSSGLLFQETFGPNALDHYTLVDEGTELGPSTWAVIGGHIVQSSNLYGGSISGSVPDKPGTMALVGSPTWDNIRLRATLRSDDDDAIGVMFRYQDADNYYRFSMDRQRSYRRLIKKVNGVVTVLWQDSVAYTMSLSYEVEMIAAGDQLLGYVNNTLLFSVSDHAITTGKVGFYCWANAGSHFESLRVESVKVPSVLWQPTFATLDGLAIVDALGGGSAPSHWTASAGDLTHSSQSPIIDPNKPQFVTHVVGGSSTWRDYRLSVQLRSDNSGEIGVMFRYQDADNCYRFSMDKQHSYRRLIKKVNGVVTVLWQDQVPYSVAHNYLLTVRITGDQITGYLDGSQLFAVSDHALKQGQIGFYCGAHTNAHFERVLVMDETRRVGAWTIHDEGAASAPSSWRQASGTLLQSSNIGSGASPDFPGTTAVTGEIAWKDYRLLVQLRSDTDGGVGAVFRYQDEDNYYRFSMDRSRHFRRLVKKVAGVMTVIWQDAGSYAPGITLTLTIEVTGGKLVGYLGDEQLFSVIDTALMAGQIGLYSYENTGARFERVEVRTPSVEAYALLRDRFASGDTSAWTFLDEGVTHGPAKWTTFEGALRQTSEIFSPPIGRHTLDKPGTQAVAGDLDWTDVIVSARLQSLDDDAIGVLFRYSDKTHWYRFSMDSQRAYRRLVKNVGGTLTLLWEDHSGYEVGRSYEFTVVAVGDTLRGYLDGVPLFVVEDGDIPSGRIGLYCWGNHDARFSQVSVYPAEQTFNDWLLDEPFNVLVNERWSFVDEGNRNAPSAWAVADGALHQTSNIYKSSFAPAIERPGTYALLGSQWGSAWSDYRVSVQLRSDDNDAIGVMFRYQDADNYYRFSMDRQRSYRRLIKKVNGVVTVLWQDNVRYIVARDYLFTMDCVADHLTGYLDGTMLFAIEDSSLTDGRIALYCWADAGARFKDVRVAAPHWTSYYTFEQEELMDAGVRARVYAGSSAASPSTEAGLLPRFAASLGEQGQIHFAAAGAELRLVAPTREGSHARHFLPDTAFAAVEARVLRKADGTAFFVTIPSASIPGSRLASGEYRLMMKYSRDNRAVEPQSQVFSADGSSLPEEVKLDVPWRKLELPPK